MTCYSPLQGFKSKALTKNGKRKIVFNPKEGLADGMIKMQAPCGQCVGCRLEYSRQWAIRCMHEASLHEDNSFITLTYNEKYLPKYGSLNYAHWESFMKRFREAIILPYAQPFVDSGFKKKEAIKLARPLSPKIRFYMGPEYSPKGRPHYHALIFGYQFPDLVLHSIRNGIKLFTSEILANLWSCPKSDERYGYVTVGNVTFQSAAYVARYMMKKVKGEDSELRYFSRDSEGRLFVDVGGEIHPIEPERARMSNKPGIASNWFDLYYKDVYNEVADYVILDGRKVRPPRYYDVLYQRISPEDYDAIKEARVIDAKVFASNNTPERLEVRRIVKEAQLNRLVRNLE